MRIKERINSQGLRGQRGSAGVLISTILILLGTVSNCYGAPESEFDVIQEALDAPQTTKAPQASSHEQPPASKQIVAEVCGGRPVAYSRAKDYVKKQLKAPATAQFPSIDDPDISVTQQKVGCAFSIFAYVDSQNSYGALLRTKYLMEVRFDFAANVWVESDWTILPNL